MSNQNMCIFMGLRFTKDYWRLSSQERLSNANEFLESLNNKVGHFSIYQAYPLNTSIDFILWISAPYVNHEDPEKLFTTIANLFSAHRSHIQTTFTLWGFTRPSDYAKGKSSQEIDPLNSEHKRYLIIYPFVKTSEWYRFGRDTRQGMMNEHIRIGHQYPNITQLLLYSTGLQDQEFVVVYETDDLPQFSALVTELRSSEARRFTERDTPLYTAIYGKPEQILSTLS